MASKKPSRTKRELRSLRLQQIVFIGIGILLILSLVLSMVVNF